MGCLGVLLEGHLSQDMGVPAMSKKPKASCQQSRLKFDKFYAKLALVVFAILTFYYLKIPTPRISNNLFV